MNIIRKLRRTILSKLPEKPREDLVQRYLYYLALRRNQRGPQSWNNLLWPSSAVSVLTLLPFVPTLIVDIGANEGAWTKAMLRVAQPACTYHLFEPLPELAHQLQSEFASQPNVHVHELAISRQQSLATFHASSFHVISSLEQLSEDHFKETYPSFATYQMQDIQVQTDTLDNVHQMLLGNQEIDLLKIDAQGHDFAILNAATTSLTRTKSIFVEWCVINTYGTAPEFTELHTLLVSRGFTLTALLNQYQSRQRLTHLDALYLNESYF